MYYLDSLYILAHFGAKSGVCSHPLFRSFVFIGALLKIKFSKKTYLIVIKDETDLKFKMNDSTLFLIGSYAQKLVASY